MDGIISRTVMAKRASRKDTVNNGAVGIIGLGPVGSILGAYLVQSGVQVYGVDALEQRTAQVNKDGLRIAGFAQLHSQPVRCFTKVEDLAEVDHLKAVFICTKTWAIKSVMDLFSQMDWPDEMRIVAFMNGIGPEDKLGEYIDKGRICRGVVNYAGNLCRSKIVSAVSTFKCNT